MLDTIRGGFREARLRFQGHGTLSADLVDEVVSEIRRSLIDADVAPEVARTFLDRVRERTVGEVVQLRAGKGEKRRKVRPHDHFVAICNEELVRVLGQVPADPLRWVKGGLTGVLVMGLQGSGKTTSVAKLAVWAEKMGHRPLMVAADIHRPAAIDQLERLGEKTDIPVFSMRGASAVEVCRGAHEHALAHQHDLILYDTAGRLAVDEVLMAELSEVKAAVQPENLLFVCDAMIGQDAVQTAGIFHERMAFDGVILTKMDGDARGGAALSIRHVTGAPVLFIGMGEDPERLELFRPEGLASRILGMGDVVGLMEDFADVVDEEKAEADARKMLKGQITFTDFLEQLRTIQRMGPLRQLLDKIPGISDAVAGGLQIDESQLRRVESMIQSMTRAERSSPELMEDDSRVRRVASGSGQSRREVRDLVERFKVVRQMMRNLGGGMNVSPSIARGLSGGFGAGGLGLGGAGLGALASKEGGTQRKRDAKAERSKRKNARKARKANRKRR